MREVDGRDVAVTVDAAPGVLAALARLGRIEDARFAPSTGRVVIAAPDRDVIVSIDLEITTDDDRPHVRLGAVTILDSARLHRPHGVDFLDDETLLVASRGCDLAVLRMPSWGPAGGSPRLIAFDPAPGLGFELAGPPSSVRVEHLADGIEAFVVCDQTNTVTAHRVDHVDGSRPTVTTNRMLLRDGLDVPDGLAITRDREWLAVTNHNRQVVLLYDRTAPLDEHSEPRGILRGVSYPHGACFTDDGQHLFVADAGRPYVHLYEQRGGSWAGVHHPALSVRVMDDPTFERGHSEREEGGPKGLDLDHDGRLLVVTAEQVPLTWLDARALLERCAESPSDLEREVTYELESLDETAERLRFVTERFESVRSSRLLRMTAPVRARYSKWFGTSS